MTLSVDAHAFGVAKRVPFVAVCLVLGPFAGLWAGGSMPNPPGNGPGVAQVIVGVAVPAILTFLAAAVVRIRSRDAALWAVASLAVTGGLVLVLRWFVQTYLPT